MYCPGMFREDRRDVLNDLIKFYPLGMLITASADHPIANLVPFSLHEEGGYDVLRAHLAKGNRQLDVLQSGAEVLVVFQGPENYVSPSWYPSKAEHGKVVPTWNYTMVQVRGLARVIDDTAWLRAQVEQLTANHENKRSYPWHVTDAPEDYVSAQIKGVVGVEISIRSIEGKWKVSQNRLSTDRQGVIDALKTEQGCSPMVAIMEKNHKG